MNYVLTYMYNKNIEYVEEKFQMYCTKYLGVKALSNSRKGNFFFIIENVSVVISIEMSLNACSRYNLFFSKSVEVE